MIPGQNVESNYFSFHDGPYAVRDHPCLGTEATWRLFAFTVASTTGRNVHSMYVLLRKSLNSKTQGTMQLSSQ